MYEIEPLEIDPRTKARLIRWFVAFVILLFLLIFGSSFFRLLADYLWYVYDAKAPIVFTTYYKTRLILFLIGFLIATPLLLWNAKHALSALSSVSVVPVTVADVIVNNILRWVRRNGIKVAKLGSPIVGLIFGIALSIRWEELLQYLNAVSFERADPVFSIDYSFYVFRLPFLQAVIGWLFGLWFICTAIAFGILLGLGAITVFTQRPALTYRGRIHLSVLIGFGFLLIGFMLWFHRYDELTRVLERFVGPGYSEIQAIRMQTVICFLLLLGSVISFLNGWRWRAFLPSIGTAVAVLLFYLLFVVIYPSIVQTFWVRPNELEYQKPYIARALQATRWAYLLDRIEVRNLAVEAEPTKEEIEQSKSTLENMRLWDPYILLRNLEVQQSLRDYYTFYDVDVDRYIIGGKQRMLMLAARDLSVEKLDPTRRTWQNIRLQYTHGNGVVAVPVNEVSLNGMPIFYLKDIPPRGLPELEIKQPRIYYNDARDSSGESIDRFVYARSRIPEFEYSPEGEGKYRWTSEGGVPLDSWWKKFLLSVALGDRDLLFSSDITSDTRLLWRRNVRVRAKHILPFLEWDYDPYIAIVNGELWWILDGYTHTDAIPYSQLTITRNGQFNYIRNSVKFAVNAYSGDWNAYVVEPNDPIVRAYQKIYPGVMKPLEEAPEGLRKHFRYPEDLFTIQSMQLQRYHVTDARTFYLGEDVWEIPMQTGAEDQGMRMPAYYVQMRIPDEPKDGFLLILPFTPIGRPNMSGWLAAHCDQETYGKLVLYRYPRERNIYGPEQQEAKFEQFASLSKEITLLSQKGSRVVSGNLLVVPVGKSVMYIKTLFLESDRPGIRALPELKIVVLAYSDRIVFSDTYPKALALLTGEETRIATRTEQEKISPPAPATKDRAQLAREALALIRESEAALQEGDWAKYGEAIHKLKNLLRKEAGEPGS